MYCFLNKILFLIRSRIDLLTFCYIEKEYFRIDSILFQEVFKRNLTNFNSIQMWIFIAIIKIEDQSILFPLFHVELIPLRDEILNKFLFVIKIRRLLSSIYVFIHSPHWCNWAVVCKFLCATFFTIHYILNLDKILRNHILHICLLGYVLDVLFIAIIFESDLV